MLDAGVLLVVIATFAAWLAGRMTIGAVNRTLPPDLHVRPRLLLPPRQIVFVKQRYRACYPDGHLVRWWTAGHYLGAAGSALIVASLLLGSGL